MEFGEWLCEEVFEGRSTPSFRVQHTQKYYAGISYMIESCSRTSAVVPEENAVPGAVVAIHTFGDFSGVASPPPCSVHGTVAFMENGMFRVAPLFEIKHLEEIFRHKVFKMLLKKEKNHRRTGGTGFQAGGTRVSMCFADQEYSREKKPLKNLARYIIRASFSQERMTYLPEESKVVYRSKDGKEERIFDALEWLAAMCFSRFQTKGNRWFVTSVFTAM